MLSERQKEILKLIVQEYIKLARPVSSNLICDTLQCSSATVRSEMAALEDLGLLEKTHTSSGRIPSEEGYRYYVDHLMVPKEISGEDVLRLQRIFGNTQLELSDCLKRSLEIISDMTSYTSIILGTASHDNLLKDINVVPLNENTMVVIVITDKGIVQNKTITLSGINLDEVKKTVALINSRIVGTPIDEVSQKLEYEIKPIIGNYVKEYEKLYNAFYNVFTNITSTNVDVVGRNNTIKLPEFASINKASNFLDKFDKGNIEKFFESEKDIDINSDGDIQVFIGRENQIDDDVTVIKTNYKTPKEEGTIAIVGPKRMEYDRVMNLLEFIKQNIEDGNTKGE